MSVVKGKTWCDGFPYLTMVKVYTDVYSADGKQVFLKVIKFGCHA